MNQAGPQAAPLRYDNVSRHHRSWPNQSAEYISHLRQSWSVSNDRQGRLVSSARARVHHIPIPCSVQIRESVESSRCWPLARKDCPNTSHLNLGIIEPRASLTSRVCHSASQPRASDDCPNSFREAPRRIARSRRYALSDTCRSSRNWLSLLTNRCAKRWTFRALRRVTLLQRERERDHRLSRQSNSSVISGPSRLTRERKKTAGIVSRRAPRPRLPASRLRFSARVEMNAFSNNKNRSLR